MFDKSIGACSPCYKLCDGGKIMSAFLYALLWAIVIAVILEFYRKFRLLKELLIYNQLAVRDSKDLKEIIANNIALIKNVDKAYVYGANGELLHSEDVLKVAKRILKERKSEGLPDEYCMPGVKGDHEVRLKSLEALVSRLEDRDRKFKERVVQVFTEGKRYNEGWSR